MVVDITVQVREAIKKLPGMTSMTHAELAQHGKCFAL